MNERIKELAEKSGIRFTFLLSNPMIPAVNAEPENIEKFAKLIVRECIDKVGMCIHPTDEREIQFGVYEAIDAETILKEHFGIE